MASSVNIVDLFNVKGRVALVTGGTSGVGFMIASVTRSASWSFGISDFPQGLVSNGAKVYITALATDDFEEQVAKLNSIGSQVGGEAIGFIGDVLSKESIEAIANYIKDRERHLDILISNAGIRRDPPIMCDVQRASLDELQTSMWSSKHSDWEDTFRINVTAHYFLSVALLKLLAAASNLDLGNGRLGRDDGRGIVVITSSCASMHNCTNIDLTSYASSKAAIDHLVPLLASKYAPCRMNPVEEGGNQFGDLFDKMPAKRIGRTEDIAGTILFLCSKAGAYIDGRCICVDGGRTLFANGQ
ncbi:putative short-chain dehydrogenase [Phaeomoniella chlamydospora]|uniref:Putative short-chain dehydrogenase n=1 Tax=Phaeomoniella chlamydospora TaxID=158046 RepID=A0A0G2DTT9_PHACM|nr:putative short-chain dehydrogenase [Phaeomoniella chlamydospora]